MTSKPKMKARMGLEIREDRKTVVDWINGKERRERREVHLGWHSASTAWVVGNYSPRERRGSHCPVHTGGDWAEGR